MGNDGNQMQDKVSNRKRVRADRVMASEAANHPISSATVKKLIQIDFIKDSSYVRGAFEILEADLRPSALKDNSINFWRRILGR